MGLFNHALARSVSGPALIGGRALIVNVVDDEAASFWRRRDFLPSKDGDSSRRANALMIPGSRLLRMNGGAHGRAKRDR